MTEHNDALARRIARIASAKPAECPQMPARRKRPSNSRAMREPVFRLASIYTGKNAHVRCVVKDVSNSGARLSLQTPQALPETVVVKFDQDGTRRRMNVVWQSDNDIGVKNSDDQTLIDAVCPPGAPAKSGR